MKRERETLEKQRRRMEDERKEREMESYQPWGRSGGGAPHTNPDGSVVRSVAGSSRKMQELQGSQNGFGNGPRDMSRFPPAPPTQAYPDANVSMQTRPQEDYSGYQTQDVFGGNSNAFLDTLRALALNPNQMQNLFSSDGTAASSSFPPAYFLFFSQHL